MVMVSKSSSKARPPPLATRREDWTELLSFVAHPLEAFSLSRNSHEATVLTGNFSLIILDVHVVESFLILDIGGDPVLSIGMAEMGDSLFSL